MGTVWSIVALLLGVRTAKAVDDAPWYVGRVVSRVSLLDPAEEGGVPDGDLWSILNTETGEPLNLSHVREDIAILQKIGAYTDIEVVAEPELDWNGGYSIHLVYQLFTTPRVRDVTFNSIPRDVRRLSEETLSIDRGQPFFVNEDPPALESRVQAALIADGWPDAQVTVSVVEVDKKEIDLFVDVTLGEPRIFQEIEIECSQMASVKAYQRWLKRAGVAPGRRVNAAVLRNAREDIQQRLFQRGWLQARLNMNFTKGSSGGEILNLRCEARGYLEISSQGWGAPSSSEVMTLLEIYPGDRVRELDIPEYQERLQQWFYRQGYAVAQVDVALESIPDGDLLRIDARRGGRYRIRRIHVDGATQFTESVLRQVFRDAADDTVKERIYTAEGIAQAQEGLQEFFRGHGFLDATVSVTVPDLDEQTLLSAATTPITIVVTVDEGEATVLRELEVVGGSGIEEQLLVDSGVVEPGALFRSAQLNTLNLQIIDLYRSIGYLNADAILTTSIDEARNEATARIEIDPGQEIILRSVLIQGNQRTRQEVIERELEVTVGQVVTPESLARTRSNLYSLGLFRVVSPQLSGDDDRSRDLLLFVEERQNILLEAGGGLSTDQGVRLTTRAAHRNLNGRARRFSALGQIGYGWRGDEWTLDFAVPIWRAALRFETPLYVRAPNVGESRGMRSRMVVEGLLNELIQEPSFRMRRSGFSVGMQFDEGDGQLEVLFDYQVQQRMLEDIDPGALVNGDPWLETLDGEMTLPSASRYHSGPEIFILWDGRDDRFNPTQGLYLNGMLSLNDGLLGGAPNIRIQMRTERWWLLSPVLVQFQTFSGVGRTADASGTLPVEDRFFLGGAGSLRGFDLNTVGPANQVLRPSIDYPDHILPLLEEAVLRDDPVHWVTTGGDAMVMMGTEVHIPLAPAGPSQTRFVVFFDVGKVGFLNPNIATTSLSEELEPFARWGTGFGLRQGTPIGPAAVDFGVNPMRIEERREPLYQIHLSVGAL